MNLNIKSSLTSLFLICISFASVAGDTAADGSNTQRGFLADANPNYEYQYLIADTLSKIKCDNLAIVSGAGPAGLVAAATLKQKGYEVIVTDKRNAFTRMNLVNINPDALHYFKKIGVLDDVKKAASNHTKHNYRLRQDMRQASIYEEKVELLLEQINPEYAYTPEAIENGFNKPSILALSIADFQECLYDFNKKLGVHFLTETTMDVQFDSDKAGCVTLHKDKASRTLGKPALIVVAEGAGSTTVAQHIGWMKTERPDETWLVSNRSVNSTSSFTGYELVLDEEAKLAKVTVGIFAEKCEEVGVSQFVRTSKTDDLAAYGAEETLHLCQIFGQNAGDCSGNTHYFTSQEKYAKAYYKGNNLIVIGDAAATSSPIAGLGFSLSVSAHAWALSQLLEADSLEAGLSDYEENVKAAVRRWISKSKDSWELTHKMVRRSAAKLHM